MKSNFVTNIIAILIAAQGFSLKAQAQKQNSFSMSLKQAEARALRFSDQLKAIQSNTESAVDNSKAQFGKLLPGLTLSGYYQYNTYVPDVSLPFPGAAPIQFGSHNNYGVGPTLSYTLWDTGAQRAAYQASKLLAQSKKDQEINARAQTLFALRAAYVRLQLGLEELKLLYSSLKLAKSQQRDINANFHAGAASLLDRVDSNREVINFQLQFKQEQSVVQSDFQDLLNLVHVRVADDQNDHLGPPGLSGVNFALKLDGLESSLQAVSRWRLTPPSEEQPELRSFTALEKSSKEQARSAWAEHFPRLRISASTMVQYPYEVELKTVEQNTFMATISMPLFEGGQIHDRVEASQSAETAARYERDQAKRDLMNAYNKAMSQLQNLKAQRKLALLDVKSSEEAAKLYESSYRAGKINFIDVEAANNRALVARVNAARIDAQMLDSIFLLESISGKDTLQ